MLGATVRFMAPVAMFNALWFAPDGGAERYTQGYGSAVLPILAEVGADLITPFLPLDAALEGGFDPDVVGFVRYPSAEAFDEMWRSDAYATAAPLRRDSTDRAVLTRCAIDPVDAGPMDLEPGIAVLNMLWFHPGGRERYDEYLEAARPLVEGVGGRYASPRYVPDAAIEDDVVPDLVFIGNYPSTDAVVSMVSSSDYERVAPIRTEAVARSMTTTLRVP